MSLDFSMKFHQKQRAYCDRFIPYQGTAHDQNVVEYKQSSSNIQRSEFYWTRYRKDLTEACFDMPFEDFKGLGVQLWRPSPRSDHSLSAQYKRLDSIHQTASKVLHTRPPKILEQVDCPSIPNNYYFNLMDVSSQDLLVIGSQNNVYYKSLLNDLNNSSHQLEREATTQVTSIKWMHEGRILVVGDADGICEVWDAERNYRLRSIDIGESRIGITTSLNDKSPIFFTGSADGGLNKFDLRQKPAHICDWKSVGGEICGLKISPDEKWIISGSNNNQAQFWDVNGGVFAEPIAVLTGHKASVKALAWHNNPRLVFTGGGTDDQSIKIWDVTNIENPTLICSQFCHAQITSMHFIKNRLFVTSGFGEAANELSTWKVNLNHQKLDKEHGFVAHEDRIFSSALSKDRSKLATLGSDSLITVWDIRESIVQAQASPDVRKTSQPLVSHFSIR